MKKTLALASAALILTACYKEHYRNDIRYLQAGENCIYESSESGRSLPKDYNENKRVVYKEAICRDVRRNDMNTAARRTIPSPWVVQETPQVAVVNVINPAPVVRNYDVRIEQAPISVTRYHTVREVERDWSRASFTRYNTAREVEIIIE